MTKFLIVAKTGNVVR